MKYSTNSSAISASGRLDTTDNICIDKSASGICDAAEMAAACEGSNIATPLTTPAILIIATSSMPQMSICVIPTSPMPMILPAIN